MTPHGAAAQLLGAIVAVHVLPLPIWLGLGWLRRAMFG